jgi:hypothetical protein
MQSSPALSYVKTDKTSGLWEGQYLYLVSLISYSTNNKSANTIDTISHVNVFNYNICAI